MCARALVRSRKDLQIVRSAVADRPKDVTRRGWTPHSRQLGNLPQLFQNHFRTNANTPVVGQFAPADDALPIDDEHRRSGDVAAVDTRLRVK